MIHSTSAVLSRPTGWGDGGVSPNSFDKHARNPVRDVLASLLLVHDPSAQACAWDYWDADGHLHIVVDAKLRELSDASLLRLLEEFAAQAGDSASVRRLADALAVRLSAEPGRYDEVRALASRAHGTARIVGHLGDGGPVAEAGPVVTAGDAWRMAGRCAERPGAGAVGPAGVGSDVDVTVVIPFRGRGEDLERVRNLAACVGSLCRQSHPRDRYRIVVVESDDEPRWRDELEPLVDDYVFAFHPGKFNKSWTVNCGVRHTARPGALVCILDGDILADEGFIARNVARFEDSTMRGLWPFRDILFLDPASSDRAIGARCDEGLPDVDDAQMRGVVLRRPPGGCVWLRRDFFLQIGGMDERFEGWGGEDVDLVWRAEFRGGLERFPDRLLHLHHRRPRHRRDDGEPFYTDLVWGTWPVDSVIGDLGRHRTAARSGTSRTRRSSETAHTKADQLPD